MLVINTSGTLNAALNARRADGTPLELHLSTHLPGGPVDRGAAPARRGRRRSRFIRRRAGEQLELPGGASVTLLTPYRADERRAEPQRPHRGCGSPRCTCPCRWHAYLERYGFPDPLQLRADSAGRTSYYQTVYATEAGQRRDALRRARLHAGADHAAGRRRACRSRRCSCTPGVASLENHEPPYEEYYRVPAETARLVNAARAAGQRVIAVGTTVVRALETVTGTRRDDPPGRRLDAAWS